MTKHNNVIPNQHFKKKWQFYVKTWFNQPARKVRRRNGKLHFCWRMSCRLPLPAFRRAVGASDCDWQHVSMFQHRRWQGSRTCSGWHVCCCGGISGSGAAANPRSKAATATICAHAAAASATVGGDSRCQAAGSLIS